MVGFWGGPLLGVQMFARNGGEKENERKRESGGAEGSLVSSSKDTNLIMGAPPSWDNPDHLLKTLPPNIIPLRVRVSICEWGCGLHKCQNTRSVTVSAEGPCSCCNKHIPEGASHGQEDSSGETHCMSHTILSCETSWHTCKGKHVLQLARSPNGKIISNHIISWLKGAKNHHREEIVFDSENIQDPKGKVYVYTSDR